MCACVLFSEVITSERGKTLECSNQGGGAGADHCCERGENKESGESTCRDVAAGSQHIEVLTMCVFICNLKCNHN